MQTVKTGDLNLITDVAGLRVGHATDETLKSGVTALICDTDTIASVHVMGGAPGATETALLSPENTVEQVDALVLSGGSAFGLDAMAGVSALLREQGRGFAVKDHHIPIVPTAILFDLINGGDKNWGQFSPYRQLGYDAGQCAKQQFELGSVGAGTGALTANCKGGLGSASTVIPLDGGRTITIGAMVAVNPLGSPLIGDSPHFWAAPFEMGDEFGGLSYPHPLPHNAHDLVIKFRDAQKTGTNTTIGIIATDAVLTKAQAKRLAVAAHDGYARAIYPSHTPLDGDLIFAVATGQSGVTPELDDWIDISAIAANTTSRAIARGIYHAHATATDILPSWKDIRRDRTKSG